MSRAFLLFDQVLLPLSQSVNSLSPLFDFSEMSKNHGVAKMKKYQNLSFSWNSGFLCEKNCGQLEESKPRREMESKLWMVDLPQPSYLCCEPISHFDGPIRNEKRKNISAVQKSWTWQGKCQINIENQTVRNYLAVGFWMLHIWGTCLMADN